MSNIETVAISTTTTLHFRRLHPGGGPLGRCSFALAGVAGIVVFDCNLFAGGVVPQSITITGTAFATPSARKVAGVTSAVVAQANNTVAVETGTPIATPITVAGTVAEGAAVVVAKAKGSRLVKAKGTKAHAAQVA